MKMFEPLFFSLFEPVWFALGNQSFLLFKGSYDVFSDG
jgi:hypothetical protein